MVVCSSQTRDSYKIFFPGNFDINIFWLLIHDRLSPAHLIKYQHKEQMLAILVIQDKTYVCCCEI